MAYDETWDRPHEPGAGELWQESDCYWFYDAKAQVGGYHRVGQFPGRGTGQAMIFTYEANGECFRLLQQYGPEACSRSADAQKVGSSEVLALGNGAMRSNGASPTAKPRSSSTIRSTRRGAG